MKVLMRKCRSCGRYTLQNICPECGEKTFMPIPPKFSPEDPYGKYRRKLRREVGFFSFRR
ncbi:ribosome biogenesis protein [Archaeoglobales archaeon ex4484_92]|nr:MAG: ribosome biogenesis protein [Archaeoglobales archaeon ex4484_92]HDN74517.1 RNA-protein complex protein Nop10 [Archaeoglobus sp.]